MLGKYEEALGMHDKQQASAQSALDEGRTYHGRGQVYSRMGRYKEALESHMRSLRLVGDDGIRGDVLLGTARALSGMERYEEAIKASEEGLQLACRDKQLQLLLHNQMRIDFERLGDWRRSFACCLKAIEVMESEGFCVSPVQKASVLQTLGRYYQSFRLPQKAEDCFRASLSVLTGCGDRRAEVCAHNLLGAMLHSQNNPEGMEHLNKSLEIAKELGARGDVVAATGALGHAHLRAEQPAEALVHFVQGLEGGEALPWETQGALQNSICEVLLALRQPALAAVFAWRAALCFQRVEVRLSCDEWMVSFFDGFKGIVARLVGVLLHLGRKRLACVVADTMKARALAKRLRPVLWAFPSEGTPEPRGTVAALLRTEEMKPLVDVLRRVAQQPSNTDNGNVVTAESWEPIETLQWGDRPSLGQDTGTVVEYCYATTAVGEPFLAVWVVSGTELKASLELPLRITVRDAEYDMPTALCIVRAALDPTPPGARQLDAEDDAYRVVKGKDRRHVLTKCLQPGPWTCAECASSHDDPNARPRHRFQGVDDDSDYNCCSKCCDERSFTALAAHEVDEFRAVQAWIAQQQQATQDDAADYALWKAIGLCPEVVSWRHLRHLHTSGWLEGGRWCMGSNVFVQHPKQEVRLRAYKRICAHLDARTWLRGLYDALLAPVRESLPAIDLDLTQPRNIKGLLGNRELVLIPHLELFEVPWQCLVDQKGKDLVQCYALSVVPSLATAVRLGGAGSSAEASGSLVLVGNPTPINLPLLESAAKEVNDVGDVLEPCLCPGLDVHRLVGSDATRDHVLAAMDGALLFHFAGHANVHRAALPFPGGDLTQAVLEDKVRFGGGALAVLSACDSGRGQIKSEGVLGLARALLASGACGAVVTLWQVHSESACALMASFYHFLCHHRLSLPRALQAAMLTQRAPQRTSRREPRPIDPGYWAPFLVVGATPAWLQRLGANDQGEQSAAAMSASNRREA